MGQASNTAGRALLPFLVAAVPFALLVLHFDWLCDDAFISFRFAQNFANGLGLLYNPGLAPIEGYSNFLWVLWLSLFELLDLDITVAAPVSSAACGLARSTSCAPSTRASPPLARSSPASSSGVYLPETCQY